MPNKPDVLRRLNLVQSLVPGETDNVIILGESVDGYSLNFDNQLISIFDLDLSKLGTNLASSPLHEVLKSTLELGLTKFKFGRITGAGGAKAQTVVINDFNGAPAPTLRFQWTLGSEGNLYRIDIARGKGSTTDTGAGRLDTKVSLIEIATGKVLKSLDGVTMNRAGTSYLVGLWNAFGLNAIATDQTPNDTYENTDEPAIGSYVFTGGIAPAAATDTEIQAAITALVARADTMLAFIGVYGFSSTNLNLLAANSFNKLWTIADHLVDGATAATAKARDTALTNNTQSVASFVGWGYWKTNPYKRIPGLGQAMGLALRIGRERSLNFTGANIAVSGWQAAQDPVTGSTPPSFDPPTELDGFADAYTNPIYEIPAGEGRTGVVVMDVLSHSRDVRYAQWGYWRAECAVVRDVMNYLKRIILNPEYPFGKKSVAGVQAAITKSTFDKIKSEIKSLIAQYPPGLLQDTAEGLGWGWSSDGSNTTTGFKPKFTLGLNFAGVAREIEFEVGAVPGQVAVAVVGGA
jgi:hypothetical protein